MRLYPRRLRILDITFDSVLAVEWDAFDVESVVIYRIPPMLHRSSNRTP